MDRAPGRPPPTAFWIGCLAGQTITAPRPKVKVRRSRALIGRLAGTVSSDRPFEALEHAAVGELG